MAVSLAWLLNMPGDIHAAIGSLEMVHLLDNPSDLMVTEKKVSGGDQSLKWHERLIPLVDIRKFLGDQAADFPVSKDNNYVGIVAYHPETGGKQKYGALPLNKLPVRITVDDEQLCDLPPDEGWSKIAISCFRHDTDDVVPILNIPCIFENRERS